MRHSHYGDLQGRFDGTGSQLFKRIWWLWALAIAAVVLISAAGLVHPGLAGFVTFLLMISLLFVYPMYKAIEWRWWASGIRFGDVRFESKLTAGRLIGLYLKVVGWFFLLILALSAVVFTAVTLLAGPGNLEGLTPETLLRQQTPILIVSVVAYVVTALALTAIIRIYLMRDLWARIATSTTVYNLAAADNVTAKGQAAGALGEGLADSLDVGGF
jgi:uncharacterized membrane protein YjgN (DUF898 family)